MDCRLGFGDVRFFEKFQTQVSKVRVLEREHNGGLSSRKKGACSMLGSFYSFVRL